MVYRPEGGETTLRMVQRRDVMCSDARFGAPTLVAKRREVLSTDARCLTATRGVVERLKVWCSDACCGGAKRAVVVRSVLW